MNTHTINRVIQSTQQPALWIIFIFAALARVLWLGDYPGGLNQDEASTGYDAWALLTAGIDRHGLSWPIHFISWGSGQNALYAYFTLPFFAVAGASLETLRLASALLGVMGLWLFWRLGRLENNSLGAWALLLVATSPWHLMVSRWALEANAAPPLVLLAVAIFATSAHSQWRFVLACGLLTLTTYAYGPAYLFAPCMMICAWIIMAKQRLQTIKSYFLGAIVAFMVALPIMAFLVNNSLGSGHLHWGPISIPKYPSEARYSGIFLPLAPNGWQSIPENAVTVFKLIFAGEHDGLPWNAAPFWGAQYWFLTPFVLLGAGFALKKARLIDQLMLAWFCCALLTAVCTSANINRINLVWLPALWLAARGLWMLQTFTVWNRLAYSALAAIGVIFTVYYFTNWHKRITENFYPGLGPALLAAKAQVPSKDTLIITNKSLYTNALFYLQPNPHDYVATAEIANPTAAFASVNGFKGVKFGINYQALQPAHYWVAHKTEWAQFPLPYFKKQAFQDYAFITRNSPEIAAQYRSLDLYLFAGSQDHGTLGINQEVDNYTPGLTLAEQTFATGLGIHGTSRWSTPLKGDEIQLDIGFGLSANSGCSDGMSFSIEVDGQEVFNSGHFTQGQIAFVQVALNKATQLTLATQAGNNNACDHGLWLTPFVKTQHPY